MAVPPTAGASDWADRAWGALARSYLRTDRRGRVVGIERRRRVDAWTASQVMAAAQVRALRHPEVWGAYDGLQVGFTDHLHRGLGYTAAVRGSPEIYYDDNAWVGLVAIGAVLARGVAGAAPAPEVDRDLAQARLVLRLLRDGEDPTRGGVYWRVGGDTRNACSTGPAGLLAARVVEAERSLGREVADHGDLVAFGRRCAEFLDRLAGDDDLVRDHERSDGSIDPLVFSYNQGTAIGLRVQLARAGGSQDLARAHTLAKLPCGGTGQGTRCHCCGATARRSSRSWPATCCPCSPWTATRAGFSSWTPGEGRWNGRLAIAPGGTSAPASRRTAGITRWIRRGCRTPIRRANWTMDCTPC